MAITNNYRTFTHKYNTEHYMHSQIYTEHLRKITKSIGQLHALKNKHRILIYIYKHRTFTHIYKQVMHLQINTVQLHAITNKHSTIACN